jgi:hypothetical protein
MRNARRLILALVAGIGGSMLACSDAALADKRVALVIAPAEHHRRNVSPVSPAISRPAPQAPRC